MFCPGSEMESIDLGAGIRLRVMGQGEALNAMLWNTPAGTAAPSHQHPQEQIGYVIRGRIAVTVGDQTEILGPGDCYFIPPDVPHGFRLIEDSEVVDVFSPPRPAPESGGDSSATGARVQ